MVHEHDPFAKRHRFYLIVRDVDDRGCEPPMQPGDFGPHLHAELGIEVRKRLVKEENFRLANDRSPQRDTLPLSAGKLSGPSLQQRLDRQDLGRLPDLLINFACGVRRIRKPNAMFW